MKECGMKSGSISSDFAVFGQLCFLAKIYFRRQKLLLSISLVLGFFAETMAMVMPQLTGNLAGTLGEWAAFRHAAILFLCVGLIQFIFAVTNDVFDRLLKDRIDRDAYCFTHDRILTMDPAYFQDHSSGENLLNIGSGRGIAYEILELICFPVFYGGGMVVGLILLFQSLNNIRLPLWLTILLVAGMAVQPFLTWYFGRLIAKAYTKVRESSQQINEEVLNNLRAPVELRGMNALGQRIRAMFSIQHLLALRMDKAMLLHIASRYSMTLLILLFQFAIVVSVLLNYDSESMIVKDLIASILLIPLMFGHLNKLQQMYNNVKDQEPYIAKVHDIFRQQNLIADGKQDLPDDQPISVHLSDVTFAYGQNENVLSGLTMTVPPRETSAIVAPSGCGKSTVLKLLMRLYLPQSGSICLNDVLLNDLREASLREKCVCISQFPLFIKGAIADNFRLVKQNITTDEILSQIRKFRLDDILHLPPEQIPDHELSLGADNLSGGQKKMLALARSMLLEPEILILDEPSTGLDGSILEQHLVPYLKAERGRRTVICVDHNMNFISEIADRIFVLENGKIREEGRTADLLADPQSQFYEYVRRWNLEREK